MLVIIHVIYDLMIDFQIGFLPLATAAALQSMSV